MNDIDLILERDERREELLRRKEEAYDPSTGLGSPVARVPYTIPDGLPGGGTVIMVSEAMLRDPDLAQASTQVRLDLVRFRHDFEYWAWRCVKIRDKESGQRIPFRLNAPQRRFLGMLEADRLAGRPLRFVMLKARQWGGSTLVQMYFAYIQMIQRRNWHSIICSHVRDTSATIRRMYRQMLEEYPEEYKEDGTPLTLKTVSGSRSKCEITGRGCTVDIGSSMSPDALRGNDFALAHLSEVAFWADGAKRSPDDFIRTISGSVPLTADTAIIMESTANGVGNFFHEVWLRAEKGSGAYRPVFVPWFEITRYRMALDPEERRDIASTLTAMETALIDRGLTLSQIAWRRWKRGEYLTDAQMASEFPASPEEAFVNTGAGVFDPADLEALRKLCADPVRKGRLSGASLTGPRAMENPRFTDDPCGPFEVWREPDPGAPARRYVVTVDIGGRSPGADWSVIAVIDRNGPEGVPELVAQWRDHADHDIVCWQAAAIARWYGRALLVIESNSLESGGVAAASDASLYILGELRRVYPHLYVRRRTERMNGTPETRPGFHTNRQTKTAALAVLIASLRDRTYIERCRGAVGEMLTYEVNDHGAYAARPGYHDDMLMTRAIALYVISQTEPVAAVPVPRLPRRPVW